MKISRLLLLLLPLFFVVANLGAQVRDLPKTLNLPSQFFLGDRDEILIQVNVWGYVGRPGQYLVPRHTDLISLISFAGGPRDGANLGEVRIIREGRTDKGTNGHNGHNNNAPVLTINVKDYLESGKQGIIPTLEAGDTVLISETFGNKLRRTVGITSVVGVIATVATVALLLERINR